MHRRPRECPAPCSRIPGTGARRTTRRTETGSLARCERGTLPHADASLCAGSTGDVLRQQSALYGEGVAIGTGPSRSIAARRPRDRVDPRDILSMTTLVVPPVPHDSPLLCPSYRDSKRVIDD